MRVEVEYFPGPGPENTEEVLRIAKKRADELGIKNIVVASTTGETGMKAVQLLKGHQVVVVTHSTGFREPNFQSLTEENRAKIIAGGGLIYTAQHAFGGFNRAVRRQFNTYQLDEIVAYVLRTFGNGMKVAIEISMMAADGGLIRTNEDVISIGGSGGGADTAIVFKPVNAQNFFDLRVREILCKPRTFELRGSWRLGQEVT